MQGAQIFYYFGVLGYVVMIENLQQRSRWRVFTTPSRYSMNSILMSNILPLDFLIFVHTIHSY